MTFAFVSGDLCLDFAGTVQHRRTDARDLLTTPADLARWAAAAGVVDAPVPVGEADLATARRLREAIYRLAGNAVAGTRYGTADRRLVNRLAADAPVRLRLTGDGAVSRSGDAGAVLATLARAAVALFAGELSGRIKECGGAGCTRLYVDGSRRGSRRWCDMRGCGNRAKAAGFRSRRTP